jgi:hypothetical protein
MKSRFIGGVNKPDLTEFEAAITFVWNNYKCEPTHAHFVDLDTLQAAEIEAQINSLNWFTSDPKRAERNLGPAFRPNLLLAILRGEELLKKLDRQIQEDALFAQFEELNRIYTNEICGAFKLAS